MRNRAALAFDVADALELRKESGQLYFEFLSASTMSVGVYTLAAGTSDPQQPHTEDEIYYVLSGQGRIRIGTEDLDVSPGSLVFVAAGESHKFHSITEELQLLVVFSPPRGSRKD